MKILLAQPANLRFQWELEVCITSIRALDKETPIVVLFLEEGPMSLDTIAYMRVKYPYLEIHSYNDERSQINYHPTVRPYLVWRYLSEDPSREREDYFQIDSDVIFREMPDFSKMPLDGKVCWGSDCDGYIGAGYLESREQGEWIVERFSGMAGVSVDNFRETPGIGAQWLMSRPTAEMWHDIWRLSQDFYDFLVPVKSDVQKWTAEMWAELFCLISHGYEIKVSGELEFCRPTDPIEDWFKTKIFHNAGVTYENARYLFFKGKYDREVPFHANLSFVDPTKAGKMYAKAIRDVVS